MYLDCSRSRGRTWNSGSVLRTKPWLAHFMANLGIGWNQNRFNSSQRFSPVRAYRKKCISVVQHILGPVSNIKSSS